MTIKVGSRVQLINYTGGIVGVVIDIQNSTLSALAYAIVAGIPRTVAASYYLRDIEEVCQNTPTWEEAREIEAEDSLQQEAGRENQVVPRNDVGPPRTSVGDPTGTEPLLWYLGAVGRLESIPATAFLAYSPRLPTRWYISDINYSLDDRNSDSSGRDGSGEDDSGSRSLPDIDF